MHSSSVYPGNEKSKNNKFLFGLCRWKEWSLPTSAVHSSNPDIGIFDWSQSVLVYFLKRRKITIIGRKWPIV